MEELIQSLQLNAGLTAEQARKAADIFVAYIKGKVPASLHGTVDSILNSKGSIADNAKEKARQFSGEVEEVAKEFGDKVTDFFRKKN
ncbi:MAG TPA: hypothetical protein VNE41_02970 [Chitinophagaceae bacterium]|nr:hypothetical protein [Chitinophagaceae bacterium]